MSMWIHIEMDGEDHGNAPVFLNGTEWCLSDGAYSTYEFFVTQHCYPEDDDKVNSGCAEFEKRMFLCCPAIAEDVTCSFTVLDHVFVLRQVYCNRNGVEI